jgi:succinyl-diaminopimelate desuccinylase
LNVGTMSGGLNINSVPDRAEIGVDIRTIPSQEHAALRRRLQSMLGPEVELETLIDVRALRTAAENEWVQDVFEVMTAVLGTRPEPKAAPYFTDASALTPAYGGIPTVILGPGELAMAHQTDEYCELDRIDQAVEAYVQIARRWWKA